MLMPFFVFIGLVGHAYSTKSAHIDEENHLARNASSFAERAAEDAEVDRLSTLCGAKELPTLAALKVNIDQDYSALKGKWSELKKKYSAADTRKEENEILAEIETNNVATEAHRAFFEMLQDDGALARLLKIGTECTETEKKAECYQQWEEKERKTSLDLMSVCDMVRAPPAFYEYFRYAYCKACIVKSPTGEIQIVCPLNKLGYPNYPKCFGFDYLTKAEVQSPEKAKHHDVPEYEATEENMKAPAFEHCNKWKEESEFIGSGDFSYNGSPGPFHGWAAEVAKNTKSSSEKQLQKNLAVVIRAGEFCNRKDLQNKTNTLKQWPLDCRENHFSPMSATFPDAESGEVAAMCGTGCVKDLQCDLHKLDQFHLWSKYKYCRACVAKVQQGNNEFYTNICLPGVVLPPNEEWQKASETLFKCFGYASMEVQSRWAKEKKTARRSILRLLRRVIRRTLASQ